MTYRLSGLLGGDLFATALKNINDVDVILNKSLTTLKMNYTALQKYIDNDTNFLEGYTIQQNNKEVDIKTRASFVLTTDLGFSNIFARDYQNNVQYIPKLFFGVNIYYRQVNKNVSYNTMKWKWREQGLLSSRAQ